jgi:hypothetical protein
MSVPMARVAESSRETEAFPRGPVGLGSDAHKILFCRTLLDTRVSPGARAIGAAFHAILKHDRS